MAKLTWTDETTQQLQEVALSLNVESLTPEHLTFIANQLAEQSGKEVTARSIGAKLRKEGFNVQKASEINGSKWTKDQQEELQYFLENNHSKYTYAEIAAATCGGVFSAKQIQGKILSLELTDSVKPTPKAVAVRTFSAEEEATIVALVSQGVFIEDIAEQLNRSVNQIKGKSLSLKRENKINNMPVQKVSNAKVKEDVLETLSVATMSIAELATATNKTERGVKSMLSRRGVSCMDYDGAAKRAKLDKPEA